MGKYLDVMPERWRQISGRTNGCSLCLVTQWYVIKAGTTPALASRGNHEGFFAVWTRYVF